MTINETIQKYSKTKIKISETFVSLQGEGILTGVPSYFIRFHGCNGVCKWCDSEYAKDENQLKWVTIGELIDWMNEYKNIYHIVITGGEPLLQFFSLTKLLFCIKESYKLGQLRTSKLPHITIETNGTILPYERSSQWYDHFPNFVKYVDIFSVSPKLSHAYPDNIDFFKRLERLPHFFDMWRHECPKYHNVSALLQLKFVMHDIEDINEVEQILNLIERETQYNDNPRDMCPIILMPLGTSIEELNTRNKWLKNICMDYGYCLGDRLHIRLFGDKRGV